MRVLINGLQGGNRSGTGRYVEELARGLAGLDKDGDALGLVWPQELAPPTGLGDIDLIQRPTQHGRRIYFDHMGMPVLRAEWRADVVHYPANFGALRRSGPTVVTVHDLGFLRHPEWFRSDRALYYRYMAQNTLGHADHLIADSECTAADIERYLKVKGDRVSVIHLGVAEHFRAADIEEVAAVRERYGLPEQFFLYVGTVEPRKNLPRLLEAWDQVAETLPQDLVIAGRIGWKTRGVSATAQTLKHGARLHFPGFIPEDELPALLSAATAFVFPSLFEGFGLPPLEAMACGTPTLVGRGSSLDEVAGDGAVQVDPESVASIAEGLERMGQDDALRESLREKGLARAACFTWARCAAETLAVYRKLA